MAYVALYRKFRPPVFDDVKGQDHIVTTLKNQIKSDRIGHAYLFCGTRGTGKTSVAKILARAVNCDSPKDGSPCGECPTCKAIESGAAMGNVIEIDAASNNGVDNIREIIDEISYSPTVGRYKVYIIDEVHMLSTGAFNALLKSLEEPPSYVIFILATTEVQKIPITILSRCQRYDFHRITIDTIAARLREVVDKEQVKVDDRALRYIAKAADGSMRDSLSLLDQCIAFNYGEELTYDRVLGVLGAVDTAVFGKLFSYLIVQDVTGALNLLSDIVIQGRELTQFVSDFIWYLRNLMLVSTSDNMEDAVDMSTDNLAALKELAKNSDIDTIMRYIRVFSELSQNLRFAAAKRILIEVALIRLCKPQMDEDTDALLDRIRILEQRSEEMTGVLGGITSGQIAVNAGGAGGGASGFNGAGGAGSAAGAAGGVASSMEERAKMLEKAVSEDVKKVVNNWSRILIKMQNPMRTYLQKAILSQSEDGKLFIVIDNKERAQKYNDDEGRNELSAILDDAVGKRVDFEVRYANQDKPVAEQYVSLNDIHFDIEIEEEESMPESAFEAESDAGTEEQESVSDIGSDAETSEDTGIDDSGGDIITGLDEDEYYAQQAADEAASYDEQAQEYAAFERASAENSYNEQQSSDEENAFEEKDTDEE